MQKMYWRSTKLCVLMFSFEFDAVFLLCTHKLKNVNGKTDYPPAPLQGVPPGCGAALLACDLLFRSLLMQRLCWGTAAKWISATTNPPFYHQNPYLFLLWRQPGPAQPSMRLPFRTKNQALEKNLKNMVPKWFQNATTNYIKNDTFSRLTPNMKNCDWTAQAAADGGSNDPENHEK